MPSIREESLFEELIQVQFIMTEPNPKTEADSETINFI